MGLDVEERAMQDVLIDRDRFIKSVVDKVQGTAAKLIPEVKVPLDFHNSLQRKVAELGGEFGFRGVREYPVYSTEVGVEGLADVAWMAKKRLAAVFEIDSSPRAKSVLKLIALDAPFRFWIYYGHSYYLSMVRSMDMKNAIEVIRLRNVYF